MTELNRPITETPRTSNAVRIGWAILIVVTLYVCYFSHLGAIGFVGPDEPRYAWIARDMMESGDWVTPRLYGKPWFEKPPLFYWGAALSFKLFGVSEGAARLPSAICALLATLALAWLALKLYGAETARWLLLLLPTTVGMIGFSHAAATDMPFSAMLTIAMVAAAVVLGLVRDENTPILPRTPWLALLFFGFFLGLAVLAKGPAGIILCAGAVFLWALFTKRWRDALRLLHPAAIAAFCLTALPWYVLCARRNPDFFRVFIIEHNFKRFLTPEFQHVQPFWYYGPILFIALFPWITATISTLGVWAKLTLRGSLINAESDAASVFFLTYAVFIVLFFSVSKSKLPGYVLPAIPPLVILTSKWLALGIGHQKYWKSLGLAVISLTATITLGIASLELFLLLGRTYPQVTGFGFAGIIFSILGLIATLVCSIFGKRSGILLSGVILTIVLLGSATPSFLRWLDTIVSPRPIAEIVKRDATLANNVVSYRLRRGWQYGLDFYLGRPLQDWGGDYSRPIAALISPAGLKDLRERRIPYAILDRTCFEAVLVEIGGHAKDMKQSEPLKSRLIRNQTQ